MTDHLTAIKATIPPGDPSSSERMEWCKAAAAAIADVCLEHSQHQTKGKPGIVLDDNLMDAALGLEMARQHAINHLRKRGTN
jgi:hypothetical protein